MSGYIDDGSIEEYILSSKGGSIHDLAVHISGTLGIGYQNAGQMAVSKLNELQEQGKVILATANQRNGAPVYDVVG